MPFSLTNIPASFQAFINNIFREYLDIFVVAYLDDILIYLINEKNYTKQVNLVLKILEKAGMRINRSKYIFHTKEVEFLGYIMGLKGIKNRPEKSVSNIGLARITKCNRGLRVYEIRELLLTIY
jgi:hypothetical protein